MHNAECKMEGANEGEFYIVRSAFCSEREAPC